MNVRVVMIDDHRLMREALCNVLEREPGVTVVGQADDGRLGVEMVATLAPHVVVMDISMPNMNGIEATRLILADNPGIKVIALSMHADARMVEAIFRAGATGYVLKDAALADLRTALQAVMEGKPYFSPQIGSVVLDGFLAHPKETERASAFTSLTTREREVLQLLAEGRATKDIASELCLSVKTVEKHRQQLMEKLDLHSVAELTKYAIREGISEL